MKFLSVTDQQELQILYFFPWSKKMALVTVSLTWADWLLKGHNIIVCSKYYAWEPDGTAC